MGTHKANLNSWWTYYTVTDSSRMLQRHGKHDDDDDSGVAQQAPLRHPRGRPLVRARTEQRCSALVSLPLVALPPLLPAPPSRVSVAPPPARVGRVIVPAASRARPPVRPSARVPVPVPAPPPPQPPPLRPPRMPQPPPPASQSTLLVHLSSDGHSDQHYPDRSTYQQLPDSPATPPPHLTDRRNACDKADDAIIAVEADSASDHEYDISAIGDYRRSKSWSSQTNPRLVQRGIEVVRRAHPTPPAVPRIPEPVAAPAGTLARYGGLAVEMSAVRRRPANSNPARSRSPPNAHPATRERSNPRRPSEDRPLARRQPPEEALRPGQEVGEEEDEAEEDIDSEEDEEEMEEDESWIQSFCNVVGHEYFAEVSEEFIEDDFNLTGLGPMVPM